MLITRFFTDKSTYFQQLMGLISLDLACGEYFHCENSGECVDPSHVCNFHTDCPLGEDEGFICGEFGALNKSLSGEIGIC